MLCFYCQCGKSVVKESPTPGKKKILMRKQKNMKKAEFENLQPIWKRQFPWVKFGE